MNKNTKNYWQKNNENERHQKKKSFQLGELNIKTIT